MADYCDIVENPYNRLTIAATCLVHSNETTEFQLVDITNQLLY